MRLPRPDALAISAFSLLVGVFFYPTILQGKLPVPSDALVGLYHPWRDLYAKEYPRGAPFKNFLITDPVRQQIPWRKNAVDQWKEGKVPLWNPYNFSGAPTLANIQAAVLYPLNILFFMLSFIDAWTLLILLQPTLAGFFMYWYLRSLALRIEASLLGAIAWSFSGFNIAWLTWGTIGHVALWLPVALLAIDKLAQNHKNAPWRKIVIWSLVLVFSLIAQFFAGHAQISLYFVLIVFSYAAFRKASGIRLALPFGLVALITAVQWKPLLDWMNQSGRVLEGGNWQKEGWFIPWQHLVQFIAPDFFGNPTTLNYWGKWNYGEFVGYIGMAPLIFAFIALFHGRFKERWFWAVAVIVALVFALPTPIANLPFILKIPIVSSLQPTRFLFILDFALAIVAAYGFHYVLEKGKGRAAIIAVGFALVVLWVVALLLRLDVSLRNLVLPSAFFSAAAALLFTRKRIALWFVIGVTVVDLVRFGWKFTPFTPREYFFPETKVIAFLKQQTKPFRVMSVDKRVLPPNTASYFGIESIEGYDPIYSSRYEELLAAIARGKPDINPPFGFSRIITLESLASPLLPILNARYIVSLTPLSEPYLVKVFEEGETKVYEDQRVLPRVYAVERVVKASSKQQAIQALYDIKDYRSEAVAEGDVSVASVPTRSDERVSLTSHAADQLEIDTTLAVSRLIVITNAYHPKWRATIDGVHTSIVRTNYAFQGIVVPEGVHTVVVSFVL